MTTRKKKAKKKATTKVKQSCLCGHVLFTLNAHGFAECDSCEQLYYWNFDGQQWEEEV
jgi:hypothetical protein